MDPVSGAASIIAIIQIANKVIRACKAALETLAASDGPIESCQKAMMDLERLLPPYQSSGTTATGAKSSKAKTVLSSLTWPFKEGKATKLLGEIKQHKGTILLALTTDTAQDVKVIRKKVDDISANLTGRLTRRWCFADTDLSSRARPPGQGDIPPLLILVHRPFIDPRQACETV